MTNLEECIDGIKTNDLKKLRDFMGDVSFGHGLYEAIDNYYNGKTKTPNTAVIKASCGQEMTLELGDIDKNQDINEVTIREVTYTPK